MSTRELKLPYAAVMSLILLAAQTIFALPAFAQEVHHFDVSSPSSTVAIQTFGQQSGVQILVSGDVVADKHLNSVSGNLTTDAAFHQLLAGTGLTARYVGERSVALVADTQSSGSTEQGGASTKQSATGSDAKTKEGKKDSSGDFRVAQAAPGQASSAVSVDQQDEEAAKKKPVYLQEVIVTGSRLQQTGAEGSQQVKVYTKEEIDRSGQTTVADFLNTLPEVSISIGENGTQTFGGATTVQLHGLPVGTTLVLINGRRVETSGPSGSGVFGGFFDLNNIPLAALARVEVVAEGSSAIYGSDAIAGVVNIILNKDFDGLQLDAKYGGASGTDVTNTSIAWGGHSDKGFVSIIGSYQVGSELTRAERSITAVGDYTPYGGIDTRSYSCSPGNVFFPNGFSFNGQPPVQYAAVPAGFTGTPTVQEFSATAGTLNRCNPNASSSIIPPTNRTGVVAFGGYNLTASLELFTELMFSHTRELPAFSAPSLVGQPGFQSFTVSAQNPYNPFGQQVGISESLPSLGREEGRFTTNFFRPLVGARGHFFESWDWEVAGWEARDSSQLSNTNQLNNAAIQAALNSTDPATALNPFVDQPPGSSQLLQSLVSSQQEKFSGQTRSMNGFVRGPIFHLPSGPVAIVVGGEYDRNVLSALYDVAPFLDHTFERSNSAAFAEVRVPIVGAHVANEGASRNGDRLAVTLAERYDSYSDFGHKTTPQLGAEWRPFDGLLIRSTYSQAFDAPSLTAEHFPVFSFQNVVADPLRGNQPEFVTEVIGGNPNLQPQTGQSRTFGFVYSSPAIPDLRLSVTHWAVDENNSVQLLSPQTIVDNENLFPGDVIRAPAQNGQPGVITQVNAKFVNFGRINVSGLDFQVSYRVTTTFGQWTAALSGVETDHYSTALQPALPSVDRNSIANDDGNWAPRWKGTVTLGWQQGPLSASVDGRYVGRYQDYDSTREIGNYWFYDANFHYAVGQSFTPNNHWLRDSYVELGGVNIFNKLPEFSNFNGGTFGYDPAEADIRGRFLYVRLGVKW